ncbi:MAG: hypothetical protein AB1414_10235 [bacterium]
MAQITIKYGDDFANSYVLALNPSIFEALQRIYTDRYRQEDTAAISYERGRKWEFRLFWKAMPKTMMDTLKSIKEYQEPFKLVLSSDFHPNGEYTVNWESDFGFFYILPSTDSEFSGEIIFIEV